MEQDGMAPPPPRTTRGRGAIENTTGRFERIGMEADVEAMPDTEELPQIATEVFRDTSRSVLSFNDSPDVGFTATLNPYRGCEHGCIYCFARPTHEYLGMSAGLDFESKLFAKMDAPELLRKALSAKNWQPQTIGLSGITDCYQPLERKLKLTRQCLEVMAEFRNPVVIITKNHLVTRDIDLLAELARHDAVRVYLSVTTLDPKLARVMEPRASQPKKRLEAIHMLSEAGIPVGVMMAPVIPGLTDHEIPSLLKAVAEAGARTAGFTMLRLPYGVKDLFQTWLEAHYPLKKQKVISRIREMRGSKLNTAEFGERMRGKGDYAKTIAEIFTQSRTRYGLRQPMGGGSTDSFRKPVAQGQQLSLL